MSSEPEARPEEIAPISDAIDEWNMAVTGLRDFHRIAIFLRRPIRSKAPGLYAKLGYTTIATLEDYPPGQAQLIMCKSLV